MNLADNQSRDLSQPKKLNRRASILPERRETRAPALELNAELRTARRDNGGADALMKTLQMFDRAAQGAVDVAQQRHAEGEQEMKAQGSVDQIADNVDPQLEQRSLGYRNAVTKGRTMSDFNEASREFDLELRDMIDDDDDVDFGARRQRVLDRMEAFYSNFAIDPETKQLRPSLQTPGALRYLAEGISASRPQVEAAAMAQIERKFLRESVSHFSQNLVDQPVDTGSLDLDLALSLLPDLVPKDDVRAAFVQSMSIAASKVWTDKRTVDGLRLLDDILGRPSAEPVETPEADPSEPAWLRMIDPVTAYERTRQAGVVNGLDRLLLSPDDLRHLRQVRNQLAERMRNEWREEVEEKQGFNASSMALRLYGQGPVLTSVEVREALESQAISPEAAMSLLDLQRRNAEQAERYADRRRAIADREEHDRERAQIEAVTGRYISALTSRRMTPAQARETVIRELPRYRPNVASAILNGVMGIAGDVETSVLNGEGVRSSLGSLDRDLRDTWRSEFAKPQYRLSSQRQSALAAQSDAIIDQMQADFTQRIREGATVEAARTATIERFGHRLQALLPRPR